MTVKANEVMDLVAMELWAVKDLSDCVKLLRVPGGWVMESQVDDHSGPGRNVSMVFIPIPQGYGVI